MSDIITTKSKLQLISDQFLTESIVKNTYNNQNGYHISHKNVISDGDEKGKGESSTIGGLTDINTRTESVVRNIYNNNKTYPDFQ
jgi:hypothetical protein